MPAATGASGPHLALPLDKAEWAVLRTVVPLGLLPEAAWALDPEADRGAGRGANRGARRTEGHVAGRGDGQAEENLTGPPASTTAPDLLPAVVSLLQRGVLARSDEKTPTPHPDVLELLASAHGAPRAVHARAGVGVVRRETVLALLPGRHVVELRADSRAGCLIAAGPLTTALDRIDTLLDGCSPEPEEVLRPDDRARTGTSAWAARRPRHVGLVESRTALDPAAAGAPGAAEGSGVPGDLLAPLTTGTTAHLSIRCVEPGGAVTHHAEWFQGRDQRWRAVTLTLRATSRSQDDGSSGDAITASGLAARGVLTFSATDRALMRAELLHALMDDRGARRAS